MTAIHKHRPDGETRIHGVKTRQLRVMPDERGRLMELLSSDDDIFVRFAHSYVTTAYPGVVKAWHLHHQQVDTLAVLQGMVKLVLYDGRTPSPTEGVVQEFFLGVHNPLMVQVPAGVMHGFKCISQDEAMVINFPSEEYRRQDPDEYRVSPDDPSIPYDWARKDG